MKHSDPKYAFINVGRLSKKLALLYYTFVHVSFNFSIHDAI